MPIKTFRGQLADGGLERIRLSTNNGMRGFRIIQFQLGGVQPGQQSQESVVQVWKTKPDAPSTTAVTVDFGLNQLLAFAYLSDHDNHSYIGAEKVIFDREIFNQDIYITHTNTYGSEPCNYYIELEQIALNQNSQSVATLKDIRSNIN